VQFIAVHQREKGVQKNVEWFYVNDSLVYAESNWINIRSLKSVKNEKLYLQKGHLVVWMNSQNVPAETSSADFREMDKSLAAYGIKMKEGLRK
jgi:hypothetical protein